MCNFRTFMVDIKKYTYSLQKVLSMIDNDVDMSNCSLMHETNINGLPFVNDAVGGKKDIR